MSKLLNTNIQINKVVVPNTCVYICSLCKKEVTINSQNVVCNKCGNRILFKKRTSKTIEYLAR